MSTKNNSLLISRSSVENSQVSDNNTQYSLNGVNFFTDFQKKEEETCQNQLSEQIYRIVDLLGHLFQSSIFFLVIYPRRDDACPLGSSEIDVDDVTPSNNVEFFIPGFFCFHQSF
jgi:hypothetical protein